MIVGAKAWTTAHDELLARLYDNESMTPKFIAVRLGRSVGSVRVRLTKLRKEGKVGPARGRGGKVVKP